MTEDNSTETTSKWPNIDAQTELKRPRLIAFLFADWATIDRDGKVALGGIFDQVKLPDEENVFPFFHLYLRLAQAYERELRVVIYTPNGVAAGEIQLEQPLDSLQASAEELKYVQLVSSIRFPNKGAGIYWFDIRYGDESLAIIPLDVKPPEKTDGSANQEPHGDH